MGMATRRRVWIGAGLGLAALFAWFVARAGQLLVVDAPRAADVIVVLAGETDHRPARALELLQEGYAHRVLIDVPTNDKIYTFTQLELAQKYIQGLPQRAAVGICPIESLSTKAETQDVEKCLAGEKSAMVLIVTSDFHTRRALSIFRRELPGKSFSVAAAHDDEQFGTRWWTRREWAKTLVNEWVRELWWKLVDQWY